MKQEVNNNERVLGRKLARELSQAEIAQVSGAGTCVECTCGNNGCPDYCADSSVQ